MKEKTPSKEKESAAEAVHKGDRSILVAVGIGIIVFGAMFFFLRAALQPTEHVVNGVLIQAANPRADIAAVLSPQKLVVHLAVANESDIIPQRIAAATEVVSALAVAQKNVTIQGIVAGDYCINAAKERIPCEKPHVVVDRGDCNCIRVEAGTVKVLGTDSWMLANGAKLRGIIGWALSG